MGTAERGIGTILKDPEAIRRYRLDWSEWLTGLPISGETISTSTWTVPSGITEVSTDKTGTTTTIRLSGGTAGECYVIANKITTTPSGEVDERSFTVKVVDR